jgi:hypothetical protein
VEGPAWSILARCASEFVPFPSFAPCDEQLFGFYILSRTNRFDEFGRQVSEEIQQENEVNSDQLLMRWLLRIMSRRKRTGSRQPAPLLDRTTEET